MAHTWTATATLREAATFDVTAGSGHSVTLDSDEVTGGGNAGFRPLEMLLVGAGGCAGMVVAAIMRRMRLDVTDYRVHVAATRAESHPMVFTQITIEHEVKGKDLPVDRVRQAIAQASSRLCPVVIMLEKAVATVHRYRVVDVATDVEQAGVVELGG